MLNFRRKSMELSTTIRQDRENRQGRAYRERAKREAEVRAAVNRKRAIDMSA